MDGYLKQFKMDYRAMLKGDNKIFLFYLILFVGCTNSTNMNRKLKNAAYVRENIGKYSETYSILKDSIKIYVDSTLKSFQSEYISEWQLDSMICINSSNDKLVAIVLNSSGSGKGVVGDDAEGLLGKKINNKWYFFKGGGTLIIPREHYGKDGMHPLSFYELSQIARENFLAGAIIEDNNGRYIVNDSWVETYFTDLGWGKFSNSAQYDSVHLHYIIDKWKHKIDTSQYKPFRKKPNT